MSSITSIFLFFLFFW